MHMQIVGRKLLYLVFAFAIFGVIPLRALEPEVQWSGHRCLDPVDEIPRPQMIPGVAYPKESIKQKIQGSAVLVFTVGANGKVSQVTIESATVPEFGIAAQKAILASAWKPAKAAKKSIDCRVRMTFEFVLK